jgi:hypothetical protein
MMDFFFGTGRVSLALELARIAFWSVVLLTMNVLWWHGNPTLWWFIPIWVTVTLLRHLYWHYRPPKDINPVPTRYTKHKQ